VFYTVAWLICSAVLRLFFGFRTRGRRNVPARGGVILAINHQSYLDPVIIGCAIPRPVQFMARETLFWGPFGRLIRALNAFPVSRGEADVRALREYVSRVKAGHAVLLFPEGTRTRDGRLQPLEAGVGMLAARAGAPVVPAYVDGAFRAWPRHRLLPRFAPVAVRFGRPIPVDRRQGEGRREHQERIREEIAARLREMEAEAFSRRRGRSRRPPASPWCKPLHGLAPRGARA
jgi:1-acyl-sn-glycerol-3-phosphate acyltransferase